MRSFPRYTTLTPLNSNHFNIHIYIYMFCLFIYMSDYIYIYIINEIHLPLLLTKAIFGEASLAL